jgi:3-methyl-2-oxobutanoate hydroxymethyltransferase
MAGYLITDNKKITAKHFIEMKRNGEKISMLTSYDYTIAGTLDKAGVDCILIGDSASNVVAGNDSTLPITVDEMIYHALVMLLYYAICLSAVIKSVRKMVSEMLSV